LFGVDGTLKIADFGLAHHSKNTLPTDVRMNTWCGTPHYVAPEIILQKEYDCRCDLWSLGVILFIMLAGYQPFDADSLSDLYKLILSAKYNFNPKRWENISNDAKDLVRGLLTVDPQKRYSTKDIKTHPWILQHVKRKKKVKKECIYGKPQNLVYYRTI